MEFLAQGAGDNSDSESFRSDISETFIGSLFQRRPGSGRRKKQLPWRSPWDASVSSDCHVHSTPKDHLPSRLGLVNDNNHSITSSPSPHTQSPTVTPAGSAPSPSGSRRKTKQDLAGPCCHCNAVSSPQWRKGPKGKPILCNACGIRFLRTRTLGRTMPKKRRVAVSGSVADAVNNQPKRVKPEEPITEDEECELVTDEPLATEDVLAPDDGLQEAHSGLAVLSTLEHPHEAHMPTSRLAIASNAMESLAAANWEGLNGITGGFMDEGSADQDELTDEMEQTCSLMPTTTGTALAAARGAAAAVGGTSSSSSYGHSFLGPAAAVNTHQPLSAASRHSWLLGATSRLGHSPSLALALALHQQQQQQMQQQQLLNSPAKVGNISLGSVTASPMSHNSSCHFRLDHSEYSAASGSPPATPVMLAATSLLSSGHLAASRPSHGDGVTSLLSAQQQQQLQQQQHLQTQQQLQQYIHQRQALQHHEPILAPAGSASQPLPPMRAVQALQPVQLMPSAAVQALQPVQVMSSAAANGDVLQLFRQMASALDGMGAAYELLPAVHARVSAAAAGSHKHPLDVQQQ